MGLVDYSFMWRRCAQRYAELYRSKGENMANIWWQKFPYKPTEEEFKLFQNETRRLLGLSPK